MRDFLVYVIEQFMEGLAFTFEILLRLLGSLVVIGIIGVLLWLVL